MLKEKFGADYYRFIPKNAALKTDVKKFHERTAMLREKLDEYKISNSDKLFDLLTVKTLLAINYLYTKKIYTQYE